MALVLWGLVLVSVGVATSAGASVSPESVQVLVKTLAYDEGLAARLSREPTVVLAVGFDCRAWPTGARIANHETKCEAATLTAGLVGDASARSAVLLLGEIDKAQAVLVSAQAREALVPVLAVGPTLASQDVLLAVEGTRTFIGERATKRLGARFPAAVLRLATIVSTGGSEDEEPTVREMWKGGSYPEQAREAGLEGVVKLTLTVDEQGKVVEASVAKGLGLGLDEEAVRRVKRFKFNPGRRGGVPVTMSTTFSVRFTLEE